MGLFGGGNSSSSSTTQNVTDTQDNRIQAATNSSNVNNSRGSIGVLNMLDAGAVGKSFDFAAMVADGAAKTAAASVNEAQAISISAMDAVKGAYGDSNASLADAYKTSKAGEQKIMVAAALAILAIVAIKVFGK